MEHGNQLLFLDTLIKRDNGSLHTSVSRKPILQGWDEFPNIPKYKIACIRTL